MDNPDCVMRRGEQCNTVVAQLERSRKLRLLEQNPRQRDLPSCPRYRGHRTVLSKPPLQP